MIQKIKINFIGVEYVTEEFITINSYKRHRMNSITFKDPNLSDESSGVFLLVWNISTGFRPLVRSSREPLVWRQLLILHPPGHSSLISPSFHLWRSISNQTLRQFFTKFGYHKAYKHLFNKDDFRKNRPSNSHILNAGLDVFSPELSIFSKDFLKFSTQYEYLT